MAREVFGPEKEEEGEAEEGVRGRVRGGEMRWRKKEEREE